MYKNIAGQKLYYTATQAHIVGTLVLGPWSLVLGPWSLVLGPWSLVLGPWSLVPGPWSLHPRARIS